MVAVVGPNGAGKTSLLRCMLGLRDVASGTIELANQPLNSWTIQQRAGLMSYVPQHTHSDFALRVVDLVQMGRLPSANLSIEPAIDTPATETQATDIPAIKTPANKVKPAWWQWRKRMRQINEQIANALLAVGMQGTENHLLSRLSGGELQRVLIARALMQQARILVLDEPTNHLDVYYQHQILSLLKSLKLTVILTIHDLNLAAQYCNKVLLLNEGKLLAEGAPATVFTAERLTEVFRLPCDVHLVGNSPAIPSICFHPAPSATVQSMSGGL